MATNGGTAAAATAGNNAEAPTRPTPSRGRGDKNRGRGRGRGGGGRGRGRGDGATGGAAGRGLREQGDHPTAENTDAPVPGEPTTSGPKVPNFKQQTQPAADGEEGEEADVCFICANPVTHSSIAPCNHVTCHICALRMRALYKTKDCPHCRVSHPRRLRLCSGTTLTLLLLRRLLRS